MDDLISRQAALDCVTYDVEYTTECIKALPSLQPTCNQLATDCISRQEALNIRFSDAINEDGVLYVPLRDFTDGLKSLPSAQPEPTLEQIEEYCHKRCLSIVDNALLHKYAQAEIIRCKDCKYQDENWRRVSVRWLPCMDVRTGSNWYCGSAERGKQNE